MHAALQRVHLACEINIFLSSHTHAHILGVEKNSSEIPSLPVSVSVCVYVCACGQLIVEKHGNSALANLLLNFSTKMKQNFRIKPLI